MIRSIIFYIFIVLFFTACSSEPVIHEFDSEGWKSDYKCCKDSRMKLFKILIDNKESLKKIDDNDITKLLGSPEKTDQFKREKKSYIYYISKGSQCEGDTSGIEGKKLVLEFSALGKITLVREEK